MKCFTVNNNEIISGIEINEIGSNYYISIGGSIDIPIMFCDKVIENFMIKECSVGITNNDHKIVIMPKVINYDYDDNRSLVLFQYYENIDVGFIDCHVIGITNNNFLVIMNTYTSMIRILYKKEEYYTYDGYTINISSNYDMKSFSPLKFQEDFMSTKDMIKYI